MKLNAWLCKILGCQSGSPKQVRFAYRIAIERKTTTKGHMLEIKLTTEQKVKVTLAPVTATGNPAALDGKPTWELSSGNATILVAEDGLSAELISPDLPDESLFTVKADADLGQGVEEISDAIKLISEGAKATSLGLVAGTPEPKSTPTPTPIPPP